jgi:hypothetical protein
MDRDEDAAPFQEFEPVLLFATQDDSLKALERVYVF